eukprot:SAG22_NODE_1752_length_3659_cov_18.037360_3_plen_145_part_00
MIKRQSSIKPTATNQSLVVGVNPISKDAGAESIPLESSFVLEEDSMYTCTCGKSLSATVKFCNKCGEKRRPEEAYIPPTEVKSSAQTLDALDSALVALGLANFGNGLRELGCAVPADLRELERDDLEGVGMDEAEISRLGSYNV